MPNKHCKHCGWGAHTTSNCPDAKKKRQKRTRHGSSPSKKYRGRGGGKGRGRGYQNDTPKYECWLCGSTKHFPWECHKKKKAEDTDANGDLIYDYVCFNCTESGHLVKDCPHPLNYRRSKANKNKFWQCVENGTSFEDVMIKPHESLGARPPSLHVSSDDEEYAHSIICTGSTWDEPTALEIVALVAGSPDMEITSAGPVLTFPSEGMATEALENLDGIITADGDGLTIARYSQNSDQECNEENAAGEDTPEKPAAKCPRTSAEGDN